MIQSQRFTQRVTQSARDSLRESLRESEIPSESHSESHSECHRFTQRVTQRVRDSLRESLRVRDREWFRESEINVEIHSEIQSDSQHPHLWSWPLESVCATESNCARLSQILKTLKRTYSISNTVPEHYPRLSVSHASCSGINRETFCRDLVRGHWNLSNVS